MRAYNNTIAEQKRKKIEEEIEEKHKELDSKVENNYRRLLGFYNNVMIKKISNHPKQESKL